MTDDHGTAVFLERWWILLFYGTLLHQFLAMVDSNSPSPVRQ